MRQRATTITVLLAVLAPGSIALAEPRAGRVGVLPDYIHVRRPAGGQGSSGGRFISDYTIELQERSPTFRDMLTLLGRMPHVGILLSPRPQEFLEDNLLGRTVFRITSGTLVAWMELRVDRLRPSRSVEGIAHEFAHVVEAACLNTSDSMPALQSVLQARASAANGRSSEGPFETRFPGVIGRTVVHEWTRQDTIGQFAALASSNGLAACLRQLPVAPKPRPTDVDGN